MKRIIRLTALMLAMVMLMSSCSVINRIKYKYDNPPLEFESGGGDPSSTLKAAYRIEKSIFGIDEAITVEFFFGFLSYPEEDIEVYKKRYPYITDSSTIEILVGHRKVNNEADEPIIIRTAETGPYVSDEYRYNERTGEYNHSEMVTIPKEIFIEERGFIYIKARTVDESENGPVYHTVAYINIYYEITGDIIRLGTHQFWRDKSLCRF